MFTEICKNIIQVLKLYNFTYLESCHFWTYERLGSIAVAVECKFDCGCTAVVAILNDFLKDVIR